MRCEWIHVDGRRVRAPYQGRDFHQSIPRHPTSLAKSSKTYDHTQTSPSHAQLLFVFSGSGGGGDGANVAELGPPLLSRISKSASPYHASIVGVPSNIKSLENGMLPRNPSLTSVRPIRVVVVPYSQQLGETGITDRTWRVGRETAKVLISWVLSESKIWTRRTTLTGERGTPLPEMVEESHVLGDGCEQALLWCPLL